MELSQDTIVLFAAFVVPGLVSISVYRLLMPARQLEWGEAVIQGLFYSVLNFLILFPLVLLLASLNLGTPWGVVGTWVAALVTLGLLPALWPILLRAAFTSEWVQKRIQIPYPTAWDYFFDLRDPTFVLVHLRNGALLGGYWGPRSYAGSFPSNGDIYLEAVYKLNEKGEFGDPIPGTNGVLLRRDEYSYIELFKVPQEQDHGEARHVIRTESPIDEELPAPR